MRHLLILFTLIVCSSCNAQDPYVVLGGERFTVELAETQEKQMLGLMFRDQMPDDHGMLFVFPREGMRSFWMKNTRIPLDIMYFDRQLKLVSASLDAQPCRVRRCSGYPSVVPAMYVLELNAGTAVKLGIKAGAKLQVYFD